MLQKKMTLIKFAFFFFNQLVLQSRRGKNKTLKSDRVGFKFWVHPYFDLS